MAEKLSKQERKEMAEKAMEDRAKHPKENKGESGFAAIDNEAEKLEGQNK
ncbi:hypothetical protein PQ472_01875 [Lacticaseibacillus pabuli]|uniref:YfhD-like protein n=1 Tax=Lacticaseibacillus pabuli TaxID=3025672 RepID=A0ABY7WVM0_9LACO|nr:hypothetical protein [Lacticaseibacillus sp. KACC 23028]WDF83017.1 hypothetical protein PQ472_01875 [Lacticaseibacillus sp. KACC 23028]